MNRVLQIRYGILSYIIEHSDMQQADGFVDITSYLISTKAPPLVLQRVLWDLHNRKLASIKVKGRYREPPVPLGISLLGARVEGDEPVTYDLSQVEVLGHTTEAAAEVTMQFQLLNKQLEYFDHLVTIARIGMIAGIAEAIIALLAWLLPIQQRLAPTEGSNTQQGLQHERLLPSNAHQGSNGHVSSNPSVPIDAVSHAVYEGPSAPKTYPEKVSPTQADTLRKMR